MIKWLKTLALTFFGFFSGCAQNPPSSLPEIKDPAFNKKLTSLLDFSAPLMGVKELQQGMKNEKWLILDAREWEEYEVSHIPGARFAGYNKFDAEQWKSLPPDQPIVVYCSVGYRSEKISRKLMKMGFSHVYNLYGSIFEWVNLGFPVVDEKGQTTKMIHTYNKDWSRWVNHPSAQKVW